MARSHIIFLSLAIFIVFLTVRSEEGGLGSFKEITNFNDEMVRPAVMLAKEAIWKKTGLDYEFQTVVKGKYQVVDGIDYQLVISGMNANGSSSIYEVDVSYCPFNAPDYSVKAVHKIE